LKVQLTRLQIRNLLCLLALLPLGLGEGQSGQSPVAGTEKKLMEYGWDMPTPAQLLAHPDHLAAAPFDGLTLRLSAGQQVFRREGLDAGALKTDLAALQSLRSPKLANSYLSILAGSGPGWDWYDDAHWATTLGSLRQIVGAARAAHLRGVTFDVEPYTLNPWEYAAQPAATRHDFASFQARVRARGASFMRAAQSEYPGLQIYALFLLSANQDDLGGDAAQLQAQLKSSGYGLWPSFVNGMLDAIAPGASLVEGNESAYYYLHPEQFDQARAQTSDSLLPLVAPERRARALKQVEQGQAVFLDGALNLWKSPRFCGYYFRSDQDRLALLQQNLYHALRTSGETAWMYGEHVDWWGGTSEGYHVPPGVLRAVLEARRKWKTGEPLNLSLDRAVAAAETACNAKISIGGDLNGLSGTETPVKFEVNGVVQGQNGSFDPNCGTWNAGKRYSCTFPGDWSGTLSPWLPGVKFDPPLRRYQHQTTNDWGAHFTAVR
jgi:hypothetical protein